MGKLAPCLTLSAGTLSSGLGPALTLLPPLVLWPLGLDQNYRSFPGLSACRQWTVGSHSIHSHRGRSLIIKQSVFLSLHTAHTHTISTKSEDLMGLLNGSRIRWHHIWLLERSTGKLRVDSFRPGHLPLGEGRGSYWGDNLTRADHRIPQRFKFSLLGEGETAIRQASCLGGS